MSDEYTATAKPDNFQSWFMDKLLIGMTWPEYLRSLMTPFNMIAAAILSIGLPLIAIRFTQGLASVTDASNDYPWGILLGWGLFSGVPLSATGFVMATPITFSASSAITRWCGWAFSPGSWDTFSPSFTC